MLHKKAAQTRKILNESPELLPNHKEPDFEAPCEQELRIYEFLDSHEIFYKSPIDKMYDYFDKRREELSRSNSFSLESSEEKLSVFCKNSAKSLENCNNDEIIEGSSKSCTQTPLKCKKKLNLTLNVRKNLSESFK